MLEPIFPVYLAPLVPPAVFVLLALTMLACAVAVALALAAIWLAIDALLLVGRLPALARRALRRAASAAAVLPEPAEAVDEPEPTA